MNPTSTTTVTLKLVTNNIINSNDNNVNFVNNNKNFSSVYLADDDKLKGPPVFINPEIQVFRYLHICRPIGWTDSGLINGWTDGGLTEH